MFWATRRPPAARQRSNQPAFFENTVVAARSGSQAIMNSPTHFPDYDARRMRSA
jgi:hypothetical protein